MDYFTIPGYKALYNIFKRSVFRCFLRFFFCLFKFLIIFAPTINGKIVKSSNSQINELKLKSGFSGERAIVLPKAVVEMMQGDPIVRHLYVTDIGFYPSAAHHYRERQEPIPQYVLIIVQEGEGWYQVGGEARRQVLAGSCFLLPPGKPHAYGAAKGRPWSIFWMHISGDSAVWYGDVPPEPMDLQPNLFTRISDRLNLFDEIMNTLDNGFSIENLRYMSGLLVFFLSSIRYVNQYRQFSSEKVDGTNVIETTVHFMQENLSRRMSLQEMASYAGYSVSHFSAVFRQHTGLSPITYFNQLRIRKACDLLTSSDMTVTQISHRLGIDDPYYFSRLFSDVMGVSPREYRRQHLRQ